VRPASLDDEVLESVAEKWAATEEFEGLGFSAAEEYLQELVAYARRSRQAGKSLLLWMAL